MTDLPDPNELLDSLRDELEASVSKQGTEICRVLDELGLVHVDVPLDSPGARVLTFEYDSETIQMHWLGVSHMPAVHIAFDAGVLPVQEQDRVEVLCAMMRLNLELCGAGMMRFALQEDNELMLVMSLDLAIFNKESLKAALDAGLQIGRQWQSFEAGVEPADDLAYMVKA